MKNILAIFMLFSVFGLAQTIEKDSKNSSISPFIDGTLLAPKTTEKIPLAILIAGSGPTDRDGNQQMMVNNSLKYLAEGLYKNNIATFRYDKRIVKQLKEQTIDEAAIKFDDFIKDATDVLSYFSEAETFSKIYVIGHSQGSLVGIIAAQNNADGFISIAGAGQTIDNVIVEQLRKQAPALTENARIAFDEMKTNGSTTNYHIGLASIFREALQPFIYNWMKYNPQEEIAKLDIPVMIVNGDNDIQVSVSEAVLLHKAKPGAEFLIVPKMNHILKKIEGDIAANQKAYNDTELPVIPQLISEVSNFIKAH